MILKFSFLIYLEPSPINIYRRLSLIYGVVMINKKFFIQAGLSLISSIPLTKYSIEILTKKCESCDLSVLEQITRNIEIGEEIKKCDRCNLIYNFYGPGINFLFKNNSKSKSYTSFSNIGDDLNIPSYAKGINSILAGILENGLKKPMTSSVPLSAVLELTKNCNLDCSYCYINQLKGHEELKTEQWMSIIDKLTEVGVPALSFSGGEPFMRNDFFTLLEYAHSKGLSTSIATNGTMIDQKTAKKLYSNGVKYIEISILSSNEDKNDLYRKKGSFSKAIEAVKNCKMSGLTVGLAMTMTNQVKDEAEDFLELAKNLNCDVCSFFNYIPMSNGEDPLKLSNLEKEKLINQLLIKRKEYDKYFKEITILQAPEVARLHYALQNGEKFGLKQIGFTKFEKSEHLLEYVGGCFAGRFIIGVTTSGDILPCPFFRIKLGNVLTDDVSKIWKDNHILTYMRDRRNLKGKCGLCKYKILCGGCRARAYVQYGDAMESDPSCLAFN
jgi:radical SAM protein with 4Fe4S-binding SPASM domain